MAKHPQESERQWREHLPLRHWMGWHTPCADDLIPTPPNQPIEDIEYETSNRPIAPTVNR